LALAGCELNPAATGPEPTPFLLSVEPAAKAGGACRILDFAVIKQATGVQFTVAVATKHRSTETCVLQAGAESRPDLTLSVTPTTADPAVFAETMTPAGAADLTGLGKAAYRLITPAKGDSGASVELGWLSADRRLMSLRYTFAAGQDRPAANAIAPKLLALAKKVETRPRQPQATPRQPTASPRQPTATPR
jgi:hypothetical protein